MANVFTKQNVRYSNIKADAERKADEEIGGDVKGITLMTSNSKKLIEALYNGDIEKSAELLVKYTWFGTRDSTMILITSGLLVLAEKQGIDLANDKQYITNLLKYMAAGDGKKAKQECEKAKAFETAFKTILGKVPNIKENKINDIWTKYVKQIGKITKWWIGLYALTHNVAPALKKTLTPNFYRTFETNIPDSKKEKNQVDEPKKDQNTTNDFEEATDFEEALKNKNFEKVIEMLDSPVEEYWDTLQVSDAEGLAAYLRTPEHKTIKFLDTEVKFTADLVMDLSNLAGEYKFDDNNGIDVMLKRRGENALLFPMSLVSEISSAIERGKKVDFFTKNQIDYCDKIFAFAEKYNITDLKQDVKALKNIFDDVEKQIENDDVINANTPLADLGIEERMKATMKYSELLDLAKSLMEVYKEHKNDEGVTKNILAVRGILRKYLNERNS